MKITKSSLIVGLGLTAGALCAFVPKNVKVHVTDSKQTTRYWFDVASISGGGSITPASSPEFSGNLQTRTFAVANNAPGCDDAPMQPKCVGGYTASQVNLDGSGKATSVKSSGGVFQQPVETILESQP
jgi:hypothetical protein